MIAGREPGEAAISGSSTTEQPATPPAGGTQQAARREELVAVVFLAIASVLTAWSAFQATKWSGLQAIAFSEASAARAELNRATMREGEARAIDIDTFLAWIEALARENAGRAKPSERPYEPEPGTVSGFLFDRFRKEFTPAVKAWLATRPLLNPDAPPSPFAMPEYVLSAAREAAKFADLAEARAADARRYNLQSDRYVGTTVILSLVLFFSAIASKIESRSAKRVMLGAAAVFLVLGAATLASFPVALR